MADFGINTGIFKVDFTSSEVAAIRQRLRRGPLHSGPCLIIERQSGLALDSTQEPHEGSSPVFYGTHGLPWQHWRIKPAGRGTFTITSATGDLALSAPRRPEDWSPVHLRRPNSSNEQRWRLHPTDDGSAFLIESAVSPHALDATQQPERLASPHLWSTHWKAWQQWIICRLPMS
ncbi:RICIN domain-containing protein [Saccharothrix sp. BKS2]|uniref:RICIN domain-containing protein n=1 Tax=Saccharothrix sp. BKS2 TaxID=3064400 RepID=UPI0039E82EA7